MHCVEAWPDNLLCRMKNAFVVVPVGLVDVGVVGGVVGDFIGGGVLGGVVVPPPPPHPHPPLGLRW